MQVGIENRMQELPHSDEPEKSMRVGLWVGVAQSGWMGMMLWGDESPARCYEAKGRGLDQKYQAQ
jgi:hypothetical protein